MGLGWKDFKSTINKYQLKVYYYIAEFSGNYHLFAERNGVRYECKLTPTNEDFIDFGTNYLAKAVEYKSSVQVSQAWSSKRLPTGQAVIRRKHGLGKHKTKKGETLTVDYKVPYNHCKIDELEIIGAKEFDEISLESIAGLSSLKVGFDVVLPNGQYKDKSDYDADLYKDMIIRLTYLPETDGRVGFNIVLHELR